MAPGRIIPALAGNTTSNTTGCACSMDHPRSRGEYQPHGMTPSIAWGSSPLSRGIHRIRYWPWRRKGIIPALAGNTVLLRAEQTGVLDHPRSRGEYCMMAPCSVVRKGSSPLSRGILVVNIHHNKRHRIIPALAGNTASPEASPRTFTDHPRSRGEYVAADWALIRHAGSSPLSRGILSSPFRTCAARGIIPALAGNTFGRQPSAATGPDHPRSRGEYHFGTARSDQSTGSSPLSRGIPPRGRRRARRRRIIPALAGNTDPVAVAHDGHLDHPRSRGEYVLQNIEWITAVGSSPLSRGIHLLVGFCLS